MLAWKRLLALSGKGLLDLPEYDWCTQVLLNGVL